MAIKRVGVIGAGQMGNGIAHVFALAGYEVMLNDVSEEALGRALESIEGNLDRQLSRDRITAADRNFSRSHRDMEFVGGATQQMGCSCRL
jgi:3-hydroxybutyryl-CoA dehydrogenase